MSLCICRRKQPRGIAHHASELSQRFRITHPFHPLFGRDFQIVDCRHFPAEDFLTFNDDSGRLVTVRASWTDLGEPDPFVEVSAGRAYFRTEDLAALERLVAEVGDGNA